MYWVDTWDVSVWRMRYDGSAQTRVARGAPLRHPVAVAPYRGRLYWLDTYAHAYTIHYFDSTRSMYSFDR